MIAGDEIARVDAKLARIAGNVPLLLSGLAEAPEATRKVWREFITTSADDVIYWRAYKRLVQCGVPADVAAANAGVFAYGR